MTAGALSFDHGRISVDLQTRRLLVSGQDTRLGGRAFDLLAALIEQRDRVVPKHELLTLVWQGRVVEENNLQVRVMSLRRALGAAAIVTVSGRGYKFSLQQDQVEYMAAAPMPVPVAARDVLVGREALLAEAVGAIRSEGVRWLALCGPGGSGKTCLALHLTAMMAAEVSNGVFVVMLAPVREQVHVMAAIAGALGVPERGDEALADRVATFLRIRSILLVLDNLEHLPHIGGCIESLLAQCPGLKLLTTSRARLHQRDECVIHVPPLTLPSDDSPEAMRAASAVELFVQRAAAAGHPVGKAPAQLQVVAQICRQVDGLPLAIELAVARLRVLTPEALLGRLQHSLPLLKTRNESSQLPDRHQTLRRAIDWSHELLAPEAQGLFRRLGVFVGGWSIEAAEAVASDRAAVLDLLADLIDQNLVLRVEDVNGQPRYAMLETIREFASERLAASDEQAGVHQRHAEFFANLMQTLDRQLRSGSRAPALQLLRIERHNLREAMTWSIDVGRDVGTAGCLVASAAWWWYFDDAAREGEAWARACLGLPLSPPVQARVLLALARAQVHGGQIQAGLAHSVQAAHLALQVGDVDTEAQALLLQAIPVVTQSREQAVALMQRCLGLFRSLAEPWDTALATAVLGMVLAWEPGAEDEAIPLLREARQRFLTLGDQWCLTTALHHLARIAERQGDLPSARRYAREALEAATAAEYRFLMAGAQHHLARISLAQGAIDAAMRWAAQCMATRWAQGDLRNLLLHCRWLGAVYWRQGRAREAIVLFAVGCEELDEQLSLAATIMSPGDRIEWCAAREAARLTMPQAELDVLWREAAAMPVERALAEVGIFLDRGTATVKRSP